jgi:hypothetical protein
VFRRWVAAHLAVCFGGLAVLAIVSGAHEELVVDPTAVFAAGAVPLTGLMQDLHVPWWAGLSLEPAVIGYAMLAAVALANAPAAVFRTRGMPADGAEAAQAIGRYAAGPLVWLVPATAVFIAHWFISERDGSSEIPRLTLALASAVWFLLALMAVAATVVRTGQWRARVTHGGFASGALAAGELLLRWLLGLAVVAVAVPWLVGFLWIVFDSFRG